MDLYICTSYAIETRRSDTELEELQRAWWSAVTVVSGALEIILKWLVFYIALLDISLLVESLQKTVIMGMLGY